MAEEIKKRLLRIILNSTLLIVLTISLNITIPGVLAIIRLVPEEGLSISTALMLLLIVIMAFQALRILLDLVRFVDLISDFLVKHVPGLESTEKISVVKALKEIGIVIFIILLTTALFPLFLLVPVLEPQLAIGVSLVSIAVSIVLIYDAGKTFYAVLQAGLEFFIEKVVGGSGKKDG